MSAGTVKRHLGWWLIYAILCAVEFGVRKLKEAVEKKLLPETPKDPKDPKVKEEGSK